jgi:MFS family permease
VPVRYQRAQASDSALGHRRPPTVTGTAKTDDVGDQRWLTRGVGGIGTASLLADVGHEVPTALLPSLLTATLGAPAAVLGVVEGVCDALAGGARFAGGALADDPGRRRRVAVGGYTATAALASLTGVATSVWQVAILRAGAWTARGLRVPARNALLADVVHPSAYGRAYGFERMMDNLGAVFGPLLALGLVAAVGVRWAIALSVVPGLLAAAAIVYAIRHTTRPATHPTVPLRFQVRPVLRGDLGRLMAAVTAFEVGNVAATLLILRATELLTPAHGLATATSLALALYTVHNLAATAASLPAGRTADRLGTRGPIWVLATGVALFLAAYLGFAVDTTNLALLALPFAAAGLAIGCVETAEHSAVAALAPANIRGSAFGLLAAVQAGGNLAASTVAGILWTATSPTVAFGYLAAWMLLALAGLTAARHTATAALRNGERH